MIAGLRGIVAGKDEDAVLLDVGGVIYRVGTSTTTLSELGAVGDPAELRTHLVVREDQLALFGFLTAEELTFFDVLIGVTGIGPRIACAVLSTFKPDALFAALRAGDVALKALGYSAQEIQQAMSAAVFEPGMTAEEKTFAALQQLAER